MQQLIEIPTSVSIIYKVNEPVIEFYRRIFMEVARYVGLPLLEQVLFADALIYNYSATTQRYWNDDVTPRDNNAGLKPTDFNFLLLRQYLNEHPGAGKKSFRLIK